MSNTRHSVTDGAISGHTKPILKKLYFVGFYLKNIGHDRINPLNMPLCASTCLVLAHNVMFIGLVHTQHAQ